MRRLLLLALVLLFAASMLGDPHASIAGTSPRKQPRKSGFTEFTSLSLPSGFGARAGAECDTGVSTQPAAYQGNLLLDCDGETPHNETTVAANPLDPLNVVTSYHSYQRKDSGNDNIVRVVAATSVTRDGGATWSEVIPPISPYQFTGDPALAFDTRGRVYLAGIADHEGPGGSFTGPDVVVATSLDGGSHWDPPVTVARGANAVTKNRSSRLLFNDKDFLTADTGPASPFRDRIYVTWTRFESVFSPNKALFTSPIMLSSSDDGEIWTEPLAISGFNRSLCIAPFFGAPGLCDVDQDSYPAVAPNGRVYVSFVNFNTVAQSQILVVSSADGGATWLPPSRVDFIEDFNLPISPQLEPVLTGCRFRLSFKSNTAADPSDATGRTVYVAFADNSNGTRDPVSGSFLTDLDVFLGRSTDGGATWSVVPVNPAPNDQFFPWVSVAGDGRVDVGYMDRSYSAGQAECRYGYSLTRLRFDASGGVASRTTTRVDSGLSDLGNSFWFGPNSRFIGDYTGITVDSLGRTWAAWTDQRAPVSGADPRRGQHAVAGLVP